MSGAGTGSAAAVPHGQWPAAADFSVGAAIDLARGILSRGFPTLLIASAILCAAMIPNWVLQFAAQLSLDADRDRQEAAAMRESSSARPAAGADMALAATSSGSDAEEEPASIRSGLARLMMSEDVEQSPRTRALMIASNAASVVLGILVHLPLAMGTIGIGLSLARGGSPRIRDILAGYRRLPTQVLCYILQLMALAPAMLVAGTLVAISLAMLATAAMDAGSGTAVTGSLAFLLIGAALAAASVPFMCVAAWLSARLALALCAVVDPAMRGVSAVGALAATWRATSGSALGLIGLYLLCAVVAAFTAACCFIPFIVIGLPACMAAIAAAWALLVRRVQADAPECIIRDPAAPGMWSAPSAIAARVAGQSAGVPADFGT